MKEIERPDIDLLLLIEDNNRIAAELDHYVNVLWNHRGIDEMTDTQRVFFYNECFLREVCNGGFSMFFNNISGDFAKETNASLTAISANYTAGLLNDAISQFPGGVVPKNMHLRHKVMAEIEVMANEAWSTLDERFFEWQDDIVALNVAFVKANKETF